MRNRGTRSCAPGSLSFFPQLCEIEFHTEGGGEGVPSSSNRNTFQSTTRIMSTWKSGWVRLQLGRWSEAEAPAAKDQPVSKGVRAKIGRSWWWCWMMLEISRISVSSWGSCRIIWLWKGKYVDVIMLLVNLFKSDFFLILHTFYFRTVYHIEFR